MNWKKHAVLRVKQKLRSSQLFYHLYIEYKADLGQICKQPSKETWPPRSHPLISYLTPYLKRNSMDSLISQPFSSIFCSRSNLLKPYKLHNTIVIFMPLQKIKRINRKFSFRRRCFMTIMQTTEKRKNKSRAIIRIVYF